MHPNLAEAEKQLAIAKDAYGAAVAAIDRQYLKGVIGAGGATNVAAVNRIRASFTDVSDVATIAPARALEQPAAAGAAPKAAKKKR